MDCSIFTVPSSILLPPHPKQPTSQVHSLASMERLCCSVVLLKRTIPVQEEIDLIAFFISTSPLSVPIYQKSKGGETQTEVNPPKEASETHWRWISSFLILTEAGREWKHSMLLKSVNLGCELWEGAPLLNLVVKKGKESWASKCI